LIWSVRPMQEFGLPGSTKHCSPLNGYTFFYAFIAEWLDDKITDRFFFILTV
jgi:hypothetical protein